MELHNRNIISILLYIYDIAYSTWHHETFTLCGFTQLMRLWHRFFGFFWCFTSLSNPGNCIQTVLPNCAIPSKVFEEAWAWTKSIKTCGCIGVRLHGFTSPVFSHIQLQLFGPVLKGALKNWCWKSVRFKARFAIPFSCPFLGKPLLLIFYLSLLFVVCSCHVQIKQNLAWMPKPCAVSIKYFSSFPRKKRLLKRRDLRWKRMQIPLSSGVPERLAGA